MVTESGSECHIIWLNEARFLSLCMSTPISERALLLQRILWEEIQRVTGQPPPPNTTSKDCHFTVLYNDGRGDLKALGSILRTVSHPFPFIMFLLC